MMALLAARVVCACSSGPGSAPDASSGGSGPTHGVGGAGGALAGAAAGAGGKAGRGATAGSGGQAVQSETSRCDDASLAWKTANKTNYTSYPEPGSEECIDFSGCEYEGLFAACDDKKSEAWVMQHDVVAIYPGLRSYQLHDLCLSKPDGSKKIIVTVYDTCADADCDGCCTENRGSADALIDVEHYTDERWGVVDGPILWADLGPTSGDGCGGD